MLLTLVGLSYNTAPVEVRERVASGLLQIGEALRSLHDLTGGGVILSTCNRTEVYVIGRECSSPEQDANTFLETLSNLRLSELSPYLYTHFQEDTVTHLFKVASGIDSMIVGEYEILGQVKQALAAAENYNLTPPPLLNLFHHAVSVGRRARDETGISKNAASISSVAIELAKKAFPNLSECEVLIIGAGEAGRLTTQALLNTGVTKIKVASRSYESAVHLSSKIGSGAVPMHSIDESLVTSDIVVSCSNSPHYLLEPSLVRSVKKSRGNSPLVIIDIAVPRDVDPRVRKISGINLYDIDDLTEISEANRKQREKEANKVIKIVNSEVDIFMSWWNSLDVMPIVSALVGKAEKIRCERLSNTLSKIPYLTEEDRTSLDMMTKSIVSRMLHDPIVCLKNNGNGNLYGEAIQHLFNLGLETKISGDSIEEV